MKVPVMGGAECFRLIRERCDVPVLIATGYAADVDAQQIVAAGAALIEKPYSTASLREEIARLLGP
jgi:CheY-like chemotaxis protein